MLTVTVVASPGAVPAVPEKVGRVGGGGAAVHGVVEGDDGGAVGDGNGFRADVEVAAVGGEEMDGDGVVGGGAFASGVGIGDVAQGIVGGEAQAIAPVDGVAGDGAAIGEVCRKVAQRERVRRAFGGGGIAGEVDEVGGVAEDNDAVVVEVVEEAGAAVRPRERAVVDLWEHNRGMGGCKEISGGWGALRCNGATRGGWRVPSLTLRVLFCGWGTFSFTAAAASVFFGGAFDP